jgi:hypothetical protein
MSSMFVTALNIATVGYFWWYLPAFPADFCEEILDLDSKASLKAQSHQAVMQAWKRTALKSNQLTLAGLILGHMVHATKQQSDAYAQYAHGVSLLSKNDIFADFSGWALIDFAAALRTALAAYGDWDGAADTFEQSMTSALGQLWQNEEALNEVKRLLKLADDLTRQQQAVILDDAIKLKTFCDAYLNTRAQREVQNTYAQRMAALESNPTQPS